MSTFLVEATQVAENRDFSCRALEKKIQEAATPSALSGYT